MNKIPQAIVRRFHCPRPGCGKSHQTMSECKMPADYERLSQLPDFSHMHGPRKGALQWTTLAQYVAVATVQKTQFLFMVALMNGKYGAVCIAAPVDQVIDPGQIGDHAHLAIGLKYKTPEKAAAACQDYLDKLKALKKLPTDKCACIELPSTKQLDALAAEPLETLELLSTAKTPAARAHNKRVMQRNRRKLESNRLRLDARARKRAGSSSRKTA